MKKQWFRSAHIFTLTVAFVLCLLILSTNSCVKFSKPSTEGYNCLFMGHSFFAPVMYHLPTHAKQAGITSHRQMVVFHGGEGGAPWHLWSSDEQDVFEAKKLIRTGTVDFVGLTSFSKGSTYEDYCRWIDLALKHNPRTVFLLQSPWPMKLDKSFSEFENRALQIEALTDAMIERLRLGYPKTRFVCIPQGRWMTELWKLFDEGKLAELKQLVAANPGEAKDSLFVDKLGHGSELALRNGALLWLAAIYDIDLDEYSFDTGTKFDLKQLAQRIIREKGDRSSSKTLDSKEAYLQYESNDPVLGFAAEELQTFLIDSSDIEFTDDTSAAKQFELKINGKLDSASFSIDCSKRNRVTIEGGSSSAVLSAVYTFLERGGIIFEVTGPLVPSEFDWDSIDGWKTHIDPIVQRRGIRWHMNKPSDISSYPLDEAVEYVKNLARMRFNHVIFHSYMGQYFTGMYNGALHRAGSLYRNEVFTVPQQEPFTNVIENDKINCLPALEAVHDNPLQKEIAVKQWLSALMKECKRMGFYIDFSFEPRAQPMQETLKTCEDILNSYPDIDCLQLFTTESYGPSGGASEEMRELLKQYFGDDATEDEQFREHVIDNAGESTIHVVRQVCHNIKAIEQLKKKYADTDLEYRLGVYTIPMDYSLAALLVLQKFAPDDLKIAFMPQYGSRAVNKKIRNMPFRKSDWRRTLIYGWIEFDGIMMMQELDVEGVRRIIRTVHEGCEQQPIPTLSFNVWKQAENRTSFRYLSQALVQGPNKPREFFEQYAEQLQLGDIDSYVAAMEKLDECIEMSEKTWNIGFTWTYMWSQLWPQSFARWERRHLVQMRDHYQSILTDLNKCRAVTVSQTGSEYLDLLINRVRCSVMHMQILVTIWDIKPILMKGMDPDAPSTLLLTQEEMKQAMLQPGELTDEQRITVIDTFTAARKIALERIELWCKNVPDRGSQGSIVHYYHCIIDGLDKMIRDYSQTNGEKTEPIRKDKGTVQPALDQ